MIWCAEADLGAIAAGTGAGDRLREPPSVGCIFAAPFSRARIFSKSCGEIPTALNFADYPNSWKQKGLPDFREPFVNNFRKFYTFWMRYFSFASSS